MPHEILQKEDLDLENWVQDIMDENYCTIKQIEPRLMVQRYNGQTYEQALPYLRGICITRQNITSFHFHAFENGYRNVINNDLELAVTFGSGNLLQLYINGEIHGELKYAHELQNVYFKLAGHCLQVSLYGS